MTLADATIGQLMIPVNAEKPQRGGAIYFRVPDIKRVAATIKERGVHFRADPHVVHRTPAMEVWLAEFTDPGGNQLALMSEVPPAAAP